LYNALAEALYLTAIERNGDVVQMASYAPLLGKEGFTQWNPDLIYFSNTEVKPTVNYYVQKLYGQNSGDAYIENNLTISDSKDAVRKRISVSVVHDSKTGDVVLKLANLLPVEVSTQVNLNEAGMLNSQAVQTTLTGKPADKKVLPVTENISVSDKFNVTLPAYSFKVIRISAKVK
jgi:alpha-L-arabinofuranosidase